MKKSKVIVPAMALLLFSTAASVTGTVAWFTSTRTFTTSVGNFSVVETEGNLKCTMGAGIGTTLADNIISVRKASGSDRAVVMTHGSVCTDAPGGTPTANYGKAFVIDPDTGNTFKDRGTDEGDGTNGWLYRSNVSMTPKVGAAVRVDVYIAVSWTMTFTYEFNGESKPVAVYLDTGASTFDKVTPDSGYDFTKDNSANDADKGFRIGFYNAVYKDTSTAAANRHDLVWGNNVPLESAPEAWAKENPYDADDKVIKDGLVYAAKSDIAANTDWTPESWTATGEITLAKTAACDAEYVNSTSTTNEYGAKDYVWPVNSASYTRVVSGVETSSTLGQANRVCVLTTTNPSVTITCAAWFEGTDPNVISGNNLTCLKADMTFYSRALSA